MLASCEARLLATRGCVSRAAHLGKRGPLLVPGREGALLALDERGSCVNDFQGICKVVIVDLAVTVLAADPAELSKPSPGQIRI